MEHNHGAESTGGKIGGSELNMAVCSIVRAEVRVGNRHGKRRVSRKCKEGQIKEED